ncbi:unnamed protein product [Linum trigynum]|uniref:Uncharacterized protein n=1 Tax=Linum trigynum TaxID=586398 RepID=A0AAV2ETZ4_9ROSI
MRQRAISRLWSGQDLFGILLEAGGQIGEAEELGSGAIRWVLSGESVLGGELGESGGLDDVHGGSLGE